jgi:carnitine 3-dehydrogenase
MLGHDEKRLHLWHELRRDTGDELIATGEHMLLHVDRAAGKTISASPEILAALDQIAAAQRDLTWPEGAGNHVRGPRVEAA